MEDILKEQRLTRSKTKIHIGITGGNGIGNGINVKEILDIETPYGRPSHPIIIGDMGNAGVAFLPRHGKNHEIASHSVNYTANIFALHQLGVQKVISAIAAGSLRKRIAPGDIAIPADFIDYTKNRKDTYFDGFPVHHFSPNEPFCPHMRATVEKEAQKLDFEVHADIVAIVIEGPRFSTRSESVLYQTIGADIINMSLYPEVILARELGMCYLSFALITDYDAGCVDGVNSDPVTLEMIDRVQDRYKERCTMLIANIASEVSGITCDKCSSHKEAARKQGGGK